MLLALHSQTHVYWWLQDHLFTRKCSTVIWYSPAFLNRLQIILAYLNKTTAGIFVNRLPVSITSFFHRHFCNFHATFLHTSHSPNLTNQKVWIVCRLLSSISTNHLYSSSFFYSALCYYYYYQRLYLHLCLSLFLNSYSATQLQMWNKAQCQCRIDHRQIFCSLQDMFIQTTPFMQCMHQTESATYAFV